MTNLIGEKYLIVYADDDPDDLELVTDAFRNFTSNVRVEVFFDGVSALSYLKNLSSLDDTPCLIILDINMPRMDGKECLKKIRETESLIHVPVVLFTTSVSERDKEFASRYKAGFISKPLSASQMELITQKLVEHCTDDIRKLISK